MANKNIYYSRLRSRIQGFDCKLDIGKGILSFELGFLLYVWRQWVLGFKGEMDKILHFYCEIIGFGELDQQAC